jgi:hypothetical protein
MTSQLKDLLFLIRQHAAYQDLLKAVELPVTREFKPSGDVQQQWADFIFRSGRKAQHNGWLSFLTESAPDAGGVTETSQTEKS